MKNIFRLLAISIVLIPNVVLANDEVEDRKITYKHKTEIAFEGLDVKGELVKPSSALVLDRKKAQFNPLIKIRTNWNEEIDESVKEIK